MSLIRETSGHVEETNVLQTIIQSNLVITDIKGPGKSVRFREVGFIWISVSQGPSELSVIEGCP